MVDDPEDLALAAVAAGITDGPSLAAPASIQQCELTVTRVSSGQEQHFMLRTGDSLKIGRSSKNDIVLAIAGVSTVHAELSLHSTPAEGLSVRDMKSKNGIGFKLKGAAQEEPAQPWQRASAEQQQVLGQDALLKVPFKSRTGDKQLPDKLRMLKLSLGPSSYAPPEVSPPPPVPFAPVEVKEAPTESEPTKAAVDLARLSSPTPRRTAPVVAAAIEPLISEGVVVQEDAVPPAAAAPALAAAVPAAVEPAPVAPAPVQQPRAAPVLVEGKSKKRRELVQPPAGAGLAPMAGGKLASTLTKAALEAMAESDATRQRRDTLIGYSVMRDMSVSPISTPGVGTRQKKKKKRPLRDVSQDVGAGFVKSKRAKPENPEGLPERKHRKAPKLTAPDPSERPSMSPCVHRDCSDSEVGDDADFEQRFRSAMSQGLEPVVRAKAARPKARATAAGVADGLLAAAVRPVAERKVPKADRVKERDPAKKKEAKERKRGDAPKAAKVKDKLRARSRSRRQSLSPKKRR